MSSPIALQEIFKAGFDDFVVPVLENAPFTTIQNRAKVTRSLKAVAGIERIHIRSINRLQNEFGPNGEQVWEADNKDSRIRMVGYGWSSIANAGDTSVQTSTTNDYLEITFYGTGVNWLVATYSAAADLRVSIDGAAEGSNIWVGTSYSSILSARNYSQNNIINLASGLTLGWHTVRVRFNAAVAVRYSGFEILNERTNLAVYSGTGIDKGNTFGLNALATSAFNAGVSGTKGARVVKYIENGQIKTAVQEVDSTIKYLTNADHTNEEILRRINFREFGANRTDDFSTLGGTASNRVFTLDDGTTTLAASSANTSTINGYEYLAVTTASSFWTLTFVGTGLDLFESYANPTTALDSATFFVDGVSIGSITSGVSGIRKICSGLPYGTHTVRMVRNAVTTTSLSVTDFIIYQPKKPSFSGFEVGDYNLTGSFSSAAAGALTVSTGVLRKDISREYVYVNGTGGSNWNIPSDFSGSFYPSPFFAESNHLNSYIEYTFFGTGFDLKHVTATNQSPNCTVTLNGVALNSSYPNASSITVRHSGNGSFGGTLVNSSALLSTLSTNVLNKNGAAAAASLAVSNLPLGIYRVRITQSAAASVNTFMTIGCFDIITPIHISQPNLKIGSLSLRSQIKYSPEKNVSNTGPDLSKAKAWVVYDMSAGRIKSSFNIAACLNGSTGFFRIYFDKPFKNSNYTVAMNSNNAINAYTSSTKNANSIEIINQSSSFTGVNTDDISVVFFGELIDE